MVTMTEGAAKKMAEYIAQEERHVEGIRLYVRPGGCAGMSYGLEFSETRDAADTVFDSNGVQVLVDPQSLRFVDGCVIDYVDTVEKTGFSISNPDRVVGCGCGQSFRVDEDAPPRA